MKFHNGRLYYFKTIILECKVCEVGTEGKREREGERERGGGKDQERKRDIGR